MLGGIENGLKGFAEEIKGLKSLAVDSPYRVDADSRVFGSEESFGHALKTVMSHIGLHLEPSLKTAERMWTTPLSETAFQGVDEMQADLDTESDDYK